MAYTHYFKDVRDYDEIDVYRILDLYEVTDAPIAHAIKKLLVPGERGTKNRIMDITEARDTLNRFLAMEEEDTPDPKKDKFYIEDEDEESTVETWGNLIKNYDNRVK